MQIKTIDPNRSNTSKIRHVVLAGILMGAACMSSLMFGSEAKAQGSVTEIQATQSNSLVLTEVVTAVVEVFEWLAGSSDRIHEGVTTGHADYLLD